MKKLIFILLCFPLIGFGQDVPLTDKKITTDKMEEKDRKLKKKKERKYNKSLAMKPAAQIGYILNPTENPFGLSYFGFSNLYENIGFYLDIRTDFNVLAPGEWALRDRDWIVNEMDGLPTGSYTEAGSNTYNIGIAINFSRSQRHAYIFYGGIGSNEKEFFEEYNVTYTGPYYAKDYGQSEYSNNYNFGILRQSNYSPVSWQIGFDSALSGINFGIGYTGN